ncbi:MAG: N-acetylmuramoyl-L-alanine amidase [Clostridiales bacterium]|nr:N-acetylmuramoyl-L-alanine amidase [Clostridiales bacterium]
MKRIQAMECIMGMMLVLMMTLLSSVGVNRITEGGDPIVDVMQPRAEEGKEYHHVVALDSGHGGIDPGKVGVHGELEKEINLAIARRVQVFLEANDILVIMVREGDEGLYQESDSHKKIADLRARCAKINESGAELAVSIHQNSYHDASVCGPQMFYYKESEKGKQLAENLQEAFLQVQPDNTRSVKCNDSYYILMHVNCPIVVAECGFLSNPEEADLLRSEDYQEKVAWAISLGILRTLNGYTAGS